MKNLGYYRGIICINGLLPVYKHLSLSCAVIHTQNCRDPGRPAVLEQYTQSKVNALGTLLFYNFKLKEFWAFSHRILF